MPRATDVAGQAVRRARARACRAGAWRVLVLDTTAPPDRRPDLGHGLSCEPDHRHGGLLWDLHPGYVPRTEDSVVIAATRRGLAEPPGIAPAPTA